MSYMRSRPARRRALGASAAEWSPIVAILPLPPPPPPPPRTRQLAPRAVRGVSSLGASAGTQVYGAVRAGIDRARGMSVSEIHPGLSVSPIHPGMTVTPIHGMDGIFDTFTAWIDGGIPAAAQDAACAGGANIFRDDYARRVAQISDQFVIPNDYYTPAQVNALVSAVMGLVNSVHNMTMQVRAEYDITALAFAENEFNDIGQASLEYLDAAHSGVDTIQSAGLRTWALDALETCVDNAEITFQVACNKPWWLSALSAFQAAFDAVYGVVQQILSALATLGRTVLKIPSILDTMVTVGLWAGGAYLAWKVFQALES